MFGTKILSSMKMWIPNMPMTLVGAKNATANAPATATFRVLPKMTKHEIKEYLKKIYDLPVVKVNTMNYMGKRKRAFGKRTIVYYKYRDFKKAIVTFDKTLIDVGRGATMEDLASTGDEKM
jgi:large subunit ribosomal protein L23